MPVALSGRVPVKVTSENGIIKPGDYLTASSIPGVAMKATKAGPVIAKSFGTFDAPGMGEVLAFVEKGSFTGMGGVTAVDDPHQSSNALLSSFVHEQETLAGSSHQSEVFTATVADTQALAS